MYLLLFELSTILETLYRINYNEGNIFQPSWFCWKNSVEKLTLYERYIPGIKMFLFNVIIFFKNIKLSSYNFHIFPD